jgi:hypothetical protein
MRPRCESASKKSNELWSTLADHATVERLRFRVIAAVEMDRTAEEQRVAEKVRVEERLVLVEEPSASWKRCSASS